MKVLVINGPNLNFLGIREKAVYGDKDYAYLVKRVEEAARELGFECEVYQSNHEGAIIDRLQEAYSDGTGAIIINPGAYTHYSYAIRDALASLEDIIKVEVHLSNIKEREAFRADSVTAPACHRQIYGLGIEGYVEALRYVAESGKDAR